MRIESDQNIRLFNDTNSLRSISANTDRHQALEQVAEQFEALFMQTMLKNMRQANEAMQMDDDENPFNSKQQKFYRSMYDSQLAMELSQKKGLGIADMIVNQLGNHVAFKPRSGLVVIKDK